MWIFLCARRATQKQLLGRWNKVADLFVFWGFLIFFHFHEIKLPLSNMRYRAGHTETLDWNLQIKKKKEGEMKWQFVAVSCLSPREKRTGRVGAHPDTGIIAPWLMGAGAFGIINFIYCVLSLSFSPSLSLSLARSLLLCPLPPSSVVAFPRLDDILLIAL